MWCRAVYEFEIVVRSNICHSVSDYHASVRILRCTTLKLDPILLTIYWIIPAAFRHQITAQLMRIQNSCVERKVCFLLQL